MGRGDGWTPLDPMERVRARLDVGVSRLAVAPSWTAWTAATSLVIGIFLGGVLPYRIDGSTGQWRYIIEHSSGALFDPDVGANSREANLTFRLVPRILGHVLHLQQPWHFWLLQLVGAIILLVLLARVLEEAFGDRRSAIIATVGSVGLWAVACSWVEIRGNFDGLAITFLLAAMLTRRPPLVLVLGVLATFTDERAVFVLPLVAVWHLVRDDQPEGPGRRPLGDALRSAPWAPVVAAFAAGFLHVAIREGLKARYGIVEGRNHSPGNPWAQLNNYPNGLWGALEGYWFLGAAGLLGLYRNGRRLAVGLVAVSVIITLVIGFSVFDISRSVMYVFPMVPVAAVGLRGLPRRWIRGLAWVAAVVSLAWPLLYAADSATVNWFYPLPMRLVDQYLLP